jgi:hypothetical protein
MDLLAPDKLTCALQQLAFLRLSLEAGDLGPVRGGGARLGLASSPRCYGARDGQRLVHCDCRCFSRYRCAEADRHVGGGFLQPGAPLIRLERNASAALARTWPSCPLSTSLTSKSHTMASRSISGSRRAAVGDTCYRCPSAASSGSARLRSGRYLRQQAGRKRAEPHYLPLAYHDVANARRNTNINMPIRMAAKNDVRMLIKSTA